MSSPMWAICPWKCTTSLAQPSERLFQTELISTSLYIKPPLMERDELGLWILHFSTVFFRACTAQTYEIMLIKKLSGPCVYATTVMREHGRKFYVKQLPDEAFKWPHLGYRKTERRRMSGRCAGNQEGKVMDCGSTVHRRIFLRGKGQSEVRLLHDVTCIASQLLESGGLWVVD